MNIVTPTEPLAFPPPVQEMTRSQPAGEASAVSAISIPDRLPSLDGWRALSILLVLGAHTVLASGFPQQHASLVNKISDGHLGVRFFFVISGFLITWLMLSEERKTSRVKLGKFYARRALRILPVYMAFLLVAGVLQYYTVCDHDLTTWIANLTFTRDFFPGGNKVSNHFWSLAVEEQFYLIWPFVFAAMAPASRAKIMPLLVAGTIVVAVICRVFWSHPLSSSPVWHSVFQEWSFLNNADSLAIGCMAAIWLAADTYGLRAWLTTRRLLVFSTGFFMLLEPQLVYWLADHPGLPSALRRAGWASSFCLGRTVQSAGFAILALQSILLPAWGLYRCLNWRPVAALGVLSYSIYIWQNLFCAKPSTYGLTDPWWMSFQFWLIPAFTTALISYHFLEKPFFNLRHRFR
ncbi:acyltransferase family protein [Prosthecobacter vanneervenii]|uniref:Peptidoglycan/LPS O-acetylase OafA/YrhL n=1 Tax=Prosthecobacter vanneervenii TaxID=48466 RepID=A0A7W8DJ30_9BACT|nr:acyltransferase [Prosthecobacter vanneervenii]MBB5031714.1 peptidoglycan/LPS O-acetylase OafA/YrhL [Prosthecobacter vanneervenii]